jgi:hypothetical protein
MKVKCPACQKNHGELAPGDYRCQCAAEFRVESQANPSGLASLRKHKHNWMPTGPATAQGQKAVCLDRDCGLRATVHNPHQGGQGRITPEGWREHQKHMPVPKGWQLAPSKGPLGMRVAKPRPGMVWIVQSSVAVTAPPTRAQREGKGVAKKYAHKTGRRAPAPAAPGSFEQYTKEEGMERTRSTPVRASDPSAPGAPPESYVSQISARMGEEARKKLARSNPSKGFIWTAYGINDKPLKGYKQLFAFNRKDAHQRFNHEYGSKVGKGEIAYLVGDTFSQWEANPDDPSGYWDYPPVEPSGMTYPGRRIKMLESDNWMEILGPSRGGGNGHIADPFTKQRHFGMFSAKGNKAVEQFALRWRDVVLSGQSVDWEEEVVPELRQLRELPGLGEAWDTEVREAIYDYIAQGDREVEMDGEIYQYPPMVTPDYYRMHDD